MYELSANSSSSWGCARQARRVPAVPVPGPVRRGGHRPTARAAADPLAAAARRARVPLSVPQASLTGALIGCSVCSPCLHVPQVAALRSGSERVIRDYYYWDLWKKSIWILFAKAISPIFVLRRNSLLPSSYFSSVAAILLLETWWTELLSTRSGQHEAAETLIGLILNDFFIRNRI